MKLNFATPCAALLAGTSLLLTACVTEVADFEDDDIATTTTRSSRTSVSTVQPGTTVRTLPSTYTTRSVAGQDYYLADDVYYTRDTNGYTVVNDPASSDYLATNAPPVRTGVVRNPSGPSSQVVNTLPSGYQTRNYNGRDYYILGGNTYVRDSAGSGYVTVESPF